MQTLIINTLLVVGGPILVSLAAAAAVSYLRTSKSARVQNMVALGNAMAKEAVLWAEETGALKNLKGGEKLSLAVESFTNKMEAAGYKVTLPVATVQAAHTELALDKTTAYNEKPCDLADAGRMSPQPE